MDDFHDFDVVRSECPTQDECRVLHERASDEAASLRIHHPRSTWEVESNAWQRLADAAWVCETILIRRRAAAERGMPPPTVSP